MTRHKKLLLAFTVSIGLVFLIICACGSILLLLLVNDARHICSEDEVDKICIRIHNRTEDKLEIGYLGANARSIRLIGDVKPFIKSDYYISDVEDTSAYTKFEFAVNSNRYVVNTFQNTSFEQLDAGYYTFEIYYTDGQYQTKIIKDR